MFFAEKGLGPRSLVISAVACAALALSPLPTVLRAPAALALVLWLPGAALMAAAFPGEPSSAGRRTLIVGLSLSWAALDGLLLGLSGFLSPAGWAVSLAGTVVLASVAAGLSSGGAPPPVRSRVVSLRMSDVALLALAAALAVAAYFHARAGALAQDEYRYTEFWLAPASNSATTAMLGIRNAEREPAAYELEVLDDDRTTARWLPVQLAPGETWTAPLAVSRGPRLRRVEARLFKTGDRRTVYRQVWMAVPAGPSSEGAFGGSGR